MGSVGNAGASELRKEVSREIAFEGWTLRRLSVHHRGERLTHGAVAALMALMMVAIVVQPYIFLLWLSVGFLLYSYNFIILLMPTTTTKMRPGEEGFDTKDLEERSIAIRLLLSNRPLALEIGLTVFLSGMIPLAWSFGLIFGVTAVFTIYHGFLMGVVPPRIAATVLVQIGFVFLLYALIYLFEPRAHGVTRLASIAHDRPLSLHSPLRTVLTAMIASLVLLGLLTSLLGLWALLLPGITVQALMETLRLLDRLDIVLFAIVLVAQLMVMRHIQGYASKRFVRRLLAMRIHALEEIERELNAISGSDEEAIRSIRRRYLSVALYDIVQHDLFGLMPVYLIGPRAKYMLDTSMLNELGGSSG